MQPEVSLATEDLVADHAIFVCLSQVNRLHVGLQVTLLPEGPPADLALVVPLPEVDNPGVHVQASPVLVALGADVTAVLLLWCHYNLAGLGFSSAETKQASVSAFFLRGSRLSSQLIHRRFAEESILENNSQSSVMNGHPKPIHSNLYQY